MRIVEMSVAQALEQAAQEPYAYITRLSQVELGPNPEHFSMDEVLEARFFGPHREIRIYQEANDFAGVMLEEEEDDVFLERIAQLRQPRFGKALTMRQYVVYDADGQGSIRDIRLVKWEGDANGRTE